jgi:hypothetical protein
MSVNARVVLLVGHDSIHNGYNHTNEKVGSHITKNLTSLSAFGSILKGFLGTDVGKCEGRTFGWTRLYTRPHVELETLRA